MISEYHTIHHTCSMEKMLPRRMSMHDCTQFWPGNGSECRFAHKLQKFLGGDNPDPRHVLGHRAVLFPDSLILAHTTFR